MKAYTSGGDKLHMCYTFDLLGASRPRLFREDAGHLRKGAGDAWACWALSNHDTVRHASRNMPFTKDPLRQGKLMAAVQLSLRGSICIYEGDELGLTEADLAYEDLVDPTASASGRSSRAATAAARRCPGRPTPSMPASRLPKPCCRCRRNTASVPPTSRSAARQPVRFLQEDDRLPQHPSLAADRRLHLVLRRTVICSSSPRGQRREDALHLQHGAGERHLQHSQRYAVSEIADLGFKSTLVGNTVTLFSEDAFVATVE